VALIYALCDEVGDWHPGEPTATRGEQSGTLTVPMSADSPFAGQTLQIRAKSIPGDGVLPSEHDYQLDTGRSFYATDDVHDLLCGTGECWTKGEPKIPGPTLTSSVPSAPSATAVFTHTAPPEPVPLTLVKWVNNSKPPKAPKVHVTVDGHETVCRSQIPAGATLSRPILDWYMHSTCYTCCYRLWPNHGPAGYERPASVTDFPPRRSPTPQDLASAAFKRAMWQLDQAMAMADHVIAGVAGSRQAYDFTVELERRLLAAAAPYAVKPSVDQSM
jgi:hypothetical protein